MSQTLVLSVGSEPMVLDTRDLILKSAGYIVVSALSIREAVRLFQDGDFDLVILCHSLPLKDCQRLKLFIRASGSRVPIVCVSETGLSDHNAIADVTLDNEPVTLLSGLKDLLSKHTHFPVPRNNTEISPAKRAFRPGSALDRHQREMQDQLGTLSLLGRTK